MTGLRLPLLALLAGCSFRVSSVDVSIPEPMSFDIGAIDLPFEPMDAATDGPASDGAACVPADDHCDGASLLSCRGGSFVTTMCPFGCAAAHCLVLDPAGTVDASDFATATASPTITSDVVFNTDDGSITGGLTRASGNGVKSAIYYRLTNQSGSSLKVGIFGFAGMTVAPGVTIRARGNAAFALVSSKDVRISGAFDLEDGCNGPHAAASGVGGSLNQPNGGGLGGGGGGGSMPMKSSGGGGGGYGDVGGAGGTAQLAGGSAGSSFGELTMEPIVLIGGGGGGSGGSAGPGGGGGGGNGGGAMQLAVSGTLTVEGTLQAGGCGGVGGGPMGSGGGGGAGGTIVIEAAKIVLASGSVIAANGGGGGAGGNTASGANGPAAAMAAAGGVGGMAGGSGGSGGAAGSTAGKTALASAMKPAGGGGGAVGRIAVRTLDGTVDDRGAIFSPALSDMSSDGKPVATLGRANFQ